MPALPAPPLLPPRDLAWIGSLLPLAGSLISIAVLSAANGHGLIALAMVTTTVLGSAVSVDQHRQRWRREVEAGRQEYAATLAGLAPDRDWTEPTPPVRADPVGIVLARRAAVTLRERSAVTQAERQVELAWGAADLRAELAPDLWLDLREASSGGVGPHGVIVGATGSGKSELLQAMVLSLALRHAPADLEFALIDFKGGAALTKLSRLPHCVGHITNLADDAATVPRMVHALNAAIDRRQQAQQSGDRLGALVIVIDEFSELLSAHPGVLDVLIRIGRVGRSLGIHLILASQRLDEGRTRELDAHVSWRLALRTFTEAESRAVIGLPDAAALPREPGWGLLRTGPEIPTRLRITPAPELFRVDALAAIAARNVTELPPPIWLPPLQESPSAQSLRSLTADHHCAVGLSDDPVCRQAITLDLLRGHTAVVGRPGSGKSSLLRTITEGSRAAGVSVHQFEASDVARRSAAQPASVEWDQICATGVTVVVIDDWSVLRQQNPLLEEALVRTAGTEPRVRLVLAAHRWADVRPALRDLLSTRIELRLTDPFDSIFDRRRAERVPLNQPGWGLFEGEPFVAARPDSLP